MKAGTLEIGGASKFAPPPRRLNRGISILDLILRVFIMAATVAAAVTMGTTSDDLPFFTTFFKFSAQWNDIDEYQFYVIASSLVCGYMAVSIILSIYHIVRSNAVASRLVLIIFDTAMMAILTAGASSAAAIAFVAHNGNSGANWIPFCQQYDDFCESTTGAIIGAYPAIVCMILLVILNAIAISRS